MAKSVPHLQLSDSRKNATLKQAGAAANFSPPRPLVSSSAPALPRGWGGRPRAGQLRRPALRAAEHRPAPRLGLRCERENTRDAGSAGDVLISPISDGVQLPTISDSAQLPTTSASASLRASLLQEVHTVHQESVSDHERHNAYNKQLVSGLLARRRPFFVRGYWPIRRLMPCRAFYTFFFCKGLSGNIIGCSRTCLA